MISSDLIITFLFSLSSSCMLCNNYTSVLLLYLDYYPDPLLVNYNPHLDPHDSEKGGPIATHLLGS